MRIKFTIYRVKRFNLECFCEWLKIGELGKVEGEEYEHFSHKNNPKSNFKKIHVRYV